MRAEIEELKNKVDIILAAEEVRQYAENIKDQLEKAEIVYRFENEKNLRNYYGAVSDIKRELAAEYHKSVKTIEKIVYNI